MGGDSSAGISSDELTGAIGPPDAAEMQTMRDIVLDEEPVVEDAVFDNILSPKELHVTFADGIGDATWSRFDITWYASGAYRFHYVDEADVNWRFDRHPNTHSPEKHFHEPPEADSQTAIQSCIEVEEPRLVTRAVLKLWRRSYETESFVELNTAQNPP